MKIDITQILTLVLGGGMVATVTAFFSGFKSLKEGARTREKSTIEDLIAQRTKAFNERDTEFEDKTWAYSDRDRWKSYAGQLIFLLNKFGHTSEIPPLPPEPPRETRP